MIEMLKIWISGLPIIALMVVFLPNEISAKARGKENALLPVPVEAVVGDQTVAKEIEGYLSQLPAEDAWNRWLIQNGPTYGNYCGAGYGDPFYEEPCLSRLDCICKAHDFGYSLRKYLDADQEMVEQILQHPLEGGEDNPDFEPFLQLAALTFFAGKVAGKNLSDTIQGAWVEFGKNPDEAVADLRTEVDHNEVFRRKMEEIAKERQAFETGLKKRTTLGLARTMAFGIEPLELFRGVLGINFEMKAQNLLAMRFGLTFAGNGLLSDSDLNFINDRRTVMSLSIGGKIYVYGKSMDKGFYIEPRVVGSYEGPKKEFGGAIRPAAFGIRPALRLGLDQIFALGFSVDFGMGVGYYFGFPLQKPTDPSQQFSGFIPELHLSVSWAW